MLDELLEYKHKVEEKDKKTQEVTRFIKCSRIQAHRMNEAANRGEQITQSRNRCP